jgi:hypothetical protein
MTPSVHHAIRECFPGHPEGQILAILGRFGRGPAHARSAIAYDCMLRCAGGSVEALERLVAEAVADPVALGEYVRRWRAWMDTAALYEREPRWMAFMAPVLRNAAPAVARHRFEHCTSHMVLCLFAEGRSELFLPSLYVVPVMDGTVVISERDEVRDVGKTPEALRAVRGELLAVEDAPARIAFHVSRLFPLVRS